MMRSKTRFMLAMNVFGLLLVSMAAAQDTAGTAKAKEAEKRTIMKSDKPAAQPSVPAGGAVVFRDPVTGEIRQPDPDEIGNLVNQPSPGLLKGRSGSGILGPIILNGILGGVGAVLDESFDSYMVVTKTPDGKVKMECVTGDKAALQQASAASVAGAKPVAKGALDIK